jgi:DNA polymerase-3 subunit delta
VLHLYYGADEFQISEALAALRTQLDVDGLLATNTTTLAPRGLTPGVLLQHISTLPFLAAARLVVVEGLLTSISGRNAVTEWTPVIEALPALPPVNHLVLVEPLTSREAGQAFARSAVVRAFREVAGAEVREFRALRTTGRENEVVPWLRERAARAGISLDPQAATALAGHIGADLRTLAGELEKLARYAGSRAISAADVELLTPDARETSIFNLVDAAVEGRTGQALVMLRRMLSHDSEEPLRVQAMIARQVRLLVRARELIDEGAPQEAIRDATGVTAGFALRKLITQARATSLPAIEAALRAIEASDRAVKTGETGDELALELLVIRLGELLGGTPARAATRAVPDRG